MKYADNYGFNKTFRRCENYIMNVERNLPCRMPSEGRCPVYGGEIMGDLISRQAAIDFIDAGHLVNPNEPRWSDNEVVNFLKSRPSAQRWIPVTERMPEPDDIVVVCTNGGQMYVWSAMPNRGDDYCWEDDYGYCHNKWEVMAWMPMPEPWKEEQESLEDYCSGDCDYCPYKGIRPPCIE